MPPVRRLNRVLRDEQKRGSIERGWSVILDGELLAWSREAGQHEKGGGKFRRLLYVHQRNLLGDKAACAGDRGEKSRECNE